MKRLIAILALVLLAGPAAARDLGQVIVGDHTIHDPGTAMLSEGQDVYQEPLSIGPGPSVSETLRVGPGACLRGPIDAFGGFHLDAGVYYPAGCNKLAMAQIRVSSGDLVLPTVDSKPIPVFATEHAALFADGEFFLTGPIADAVREGQNVLRADCETYRTWTKTLDRSDHGFLFAIEGVLPQLNNYTWTISFTGDGNVEYEKIQPSADADAYFRALAADIRCK